MRRETGKPAFYARDRVRCYTYSCLMTDFRAALSALGLDTQLGPHGIRVLAYNLSLEGNGPDLTVAHGGWKSSGHTRYQRFSQVAVQSIPARMLGLRSQWDDAPAPRAIHQRRTARGLQRLQLQDSDDEADDEADATEGEPSEAEPAAGRDTLLPVGYVERRHLVASGRSVPTYIAPDGSELRSRVQAWRHFESGRSRERSAVRTPRRRAQIPAGRRYRSTSPRESRATPRSPAMSPTVCAPAAAPSGDRTTPLARRFDLIEVAADQCGDPQCTVKSVNGSHRGPHIYPPPMPRR